VNSEVFIVCFTKSWAVLTLRPAEDALDVVIARPASRPRDGEHDEEFLIVNPRTADR